MKKFFKCLLIIGIISVSFASTILASPPKMVIQWNNDGKTVANKSQVKNQIIYDTTYQHYYAFDLNGNWVSKEGVYKGSNGYAIINNKGEALSSGWSKELFNWVFIKDWEKITNSFIDVNSKVYSEDKYPNGTKCYYVDNLGYMLTSRNITIKGTTYIIDKDGVVTLGNKTAGVFNSGKSAWVGNVLKDANNNTIPDMWANEDGSVTTKYFVDGSQEYRSDSNGRKIVNKIFSVGDVDYRASETGNCYIYTPEEDYKVDSSLKDLDVKIINWINKGGKHKYNDEWVDVGGGDWALWHNGKWCTRYWEGAVENNGKSQKWYWIGANGLMFRNVKAYGTDKNFKEITTDKNRAYKDPDTKVYFECTFADDGQWEMTVSSDFKKYLITNKKALESMTVTEVGQYYSAFLSKAEKASLKSILDLQEKAEKANSSKEVEKLDEQVNNEFSLPIEIYTKDQFYKGKYSTGQVGEKEYLTNGYYIYNKGSNKYTLYKANDTIGKTSKVIKSNISLAKIADYIDDNNIEKSAEVKEKSDSSSSSSSKSSSKKDKKLKVTIKSGYKTKDKTVNEVEYEGSYTLPTFEEMGWEEKPKYSFSHWAIGSKKYNPGDVVDNIKANKTITAKWKKN